MLSIVFLLIASTVTKPTTAATYSLIETHAGSTFFDGWIYETGYDNTTNGDTTWSSSESLAYVNSADQAIIKVDNTSTVPYNEKRDSIKLLSKNWYRPGTVFVMDAVHVPVGCSVWPAWWTRGPDWPAGGEIDIFEPVNLQTVNQVALHTTEGCTATPDPALAPPTGTLGSTNCNQNANFGAGCTVIGGDAGSIFNEKGGGAWMSGITIWQYPRSELPSSLSSTAQTIDTATLGTPIASYASSTCDIAKFFGSQQMTLDITMCGDYAGTPAILEATCGTLAPDQTCYTTYVLNSTVYNEAYFQINYLNIYGGADSIDPELSSSSPTNTGSTTQSTSDASSETLGMGTETISARITGTTVAGPGSNLVNAGSGLGFATTGMMAGSISLLGFIAALGLLFL